MKLLMITRKVDKNEHLAGFTYDWVKKLAALLNKLYVITWQANPPAELPANIEIISLPAGKLGKVLTLQKNLIKILPQVDGVFCHMNPEYTILTAPLAKLFNKKIISWYTHSAVSWRLKLMEKLTDYILTASPKSFRLPSKKVIITGHGIAVEKFVDQSSDKQSLKLTKNNFYSLLSVGRISPTKNYHQLIKAVDLLIKQHSLPVKLEIIGAPALTKQKRYLANLRETVKKLKLEEKIKFLGAKPHQVIPKYLRQADLFVNLSDTGSLDKAVLEAMASSCLVLTSNEAFKEILPRELFIEEKEAEKLARRIKELYNLPEDKIKKLKETLRQEVREHHNLDKLVRKIVSLY